MIAKQRFVEIDALKTVGIATVVLIHCVRTPWDALISPVEIWLGHLTRFGVPTFLFASGFLYATSERVSVRLTLRRLRRILLPYLIVSLAAQAWWSMLNLPTEVRAFWPDLAFGASMGPFYYVFVIAGLIVVTPLFARLPRAALTALTGAMLAAQWYVDAAIGFPIPLYWHLRNPLLWWAYFLVGWQVRLHQPAVSNWLAPRTWLPPTVLIAVVALAVQSAAAGPLLGVRTAAWLNVYAILLLVYSIACGRADASGVLRYLSDATYAIFLLHLFFVSGVQLLVPHRPSFAGFAPIALPWLAGMFGPIILLTAARALFGGRSKDIIGG